MTDTVARPPEGIVSNDRKPFCFTGPPPGWRRRASDRTRECDAPQQHGWTAAPTSAMRPRRLPGVHSSRRPAGRHPARGDRSSLAASVHSRRRTCHAPPPRCGQKERDETPRISRPSRGVSPRSGRDRATYGYVARHPLTRFETCVDGRPPPAREADRRGSALRIHVMPAQTYRRTGRWKHSRREDDRS